MEYGADGKLVMAAAIEASIAAGSEHIGTEHLLLALLQGRQSQPWASVAQVMATAGVTAPAVGRALHSEPASIQSRPFTRGQYTGNLREVERLAYAEAEGSDAAEVDSVHLFLGLLRHERGRAIWALKQLGHDHDGLLAATRTLLAAAKRPAASIDVHATSTDPIEPLTPSGPTRRDAVVPLSAHVVYPSGPLRPDWLDREQERAITLDRSLLYEHTTLLTGEGTLPAGDEVRQLQDVLIRYTGNNAVLIARPGIDATTVLNGLARDIAAREIARPLQTTTVRLLDWDSLNQRAYGRDAFYRLFRDVITQAADADILLGIADGIEYLELDVPRKAGSATSHLWAMLAKRRLRVALILTPEQYAASKNNLRDDLFVRIAVVEPSLERTLELLTRESGMFSQRYAVHVTPEAMSAAVRLADRYITDRSMPNKALDLLDRACALAAPRVDSGAVGTVGVTEVRVAIARMLGRELGEVHLPGEEPVSPTPPVPSQIRLPHEDSTAILIGTASYQDGSIPALPSVRNNVMDLRETLTHPEFGGFAPGRVHELHDPLRTPALTAIAEHASAVTDTLVLYFAGHGLTDEWGELFLNTADTDARHMRHTSLPYNEIRRIVTDSPARNKVVILDCCFSGRAIQTMGSGEPGYGDFGIGGTYVLTSTTGGRAIAPVGERHTAFTAALLRLLVEGVDPGEEYVRLIKEFPVLRGFLIESGLPEPRHMNIDQVGELALVRNRRYAR